MSHITINSILGNALNEEFMNFDLTEVQEALKYLQETTAIDLSHAEMSSQKALRAQDVLSEYLGKITMIVEDLDAKVGRIKNKVALEYKNPDGKTTADQRKFAAESSPEIEEIQIKLAKAKGAQMLLKQKLDTISKTHYHFKEIANGLKRGQPWP